MIVGQRQVDHRLVPGGRDPGQPRRRAAGQRQRRRAGGALTTPMSFMKTPALNPVPTALEKASLAAKRLASVPARVKGGGWPWPFPRR
jgi:hypothetical protein